MPRGIVHELHGLAEEDTRGDARSESNVDLGREAHEKRSRAGSLHLLERLPPLTDTGKFPLERIPVILDR